MVEIEACAILQGEKIVGQWISKRTPPMQDPVGFHSEALHYVLKEDTRKMHHILSICA
jgi:hypothetical protein